MPDLKTIGTVLVRDLEGQAEDLGKVALEDLKQAIGPALKAAPELEAAARKAYTSAARYHLQALAGQAIPFDGFEQIDAQLANVKVSALIIANDAFKKAFWSVFKSVLNALGNAAGGVVGAGVNAVANIVNGLGK